MPTDPKPLAVLDGASRPLVIWVSFEDTGTKVLVWDKPVHLKPGMRVTITARATDCIIELEGA